MAAPPSGSTPNLGGIAKGPDGALWFTDFSNAYIGRITTTGAVTRYPLPAGVTGPAYAIHTESDGNLWFTVATNASANADAFATISTSGTVTLVSSFTNVGGGYVEFAQGSDGALWYPYQTMGQKIGRLTLAGAATSSGYTTSGTPNLVGVTNGPDGNLWFTDSLSNALLRVVPGGNFKTVPLPVSSAASLQGIAVGGDNALWFGEQGGGIGRYTTAGAFTQYTVPANANGQPNPNGVCTGADGAVYFTSGNGSIIGRISNAGVVNEYPLGSTSSSSNECTLGPDGAIWFTESNGKIGRLG